MTFKLRRVKKFTIRVPQCLSNCHDRSRKLTIILLISPFVCQSVSVSSRLSVYVCRISSLSLNYRAEQEINNYSADSLPYTDCLGAAGKKSMAMSQMAYCLCGLCGCVHTCIGVVLNVLWWERRWVCLMGGQSTAFSMLKLVLCARFAFDMRSFIDLIHQSKLCLFLVIILSVCVSLCVCTCV